MADAKQILENGYDSVIGNVSNIVDNLSTTQAAIGAGVVGALVGGGVTALVSSGTRSKKKWRVINEPNQPLACCGRC